ncbi:unnamed protein product [Oncorhynchus mykiss]|uniref:Uncharacterized protein n=1 Tax=Oncorhynchus mykiss TaxID=8022 RepID=A0A060Z7U2_ONCMY|nr:unnamed protein product [Oncorhynchus mykiss]
MSTNVDHEKTFITIKEYLTHLFTGQGNTLQIFHSCPLCTRICNITKRFKGTLISIVEICPHYDHIKTWKSQPYVSDNPAGNFQLTPAFSFARQSTNKLLKALKVQAIYQSTFYSHKKWYCFQPYTGKQRVVLQQSFRDNVDLGGDMRADSSGHSAKFWSYNMVNFNMNRVLDIHLVQSNKVGNSLRMEKEGLLRIIAALEEAAVSIDSIVTDRHPSIQKYLREERPDIKYTYDGWHVAKCGGVAFHVKLVEKMP